MRVHVRLEMHDKIGEYREYTLFFKKQPSLCELGDALHDFGAILDVLNRILEDLCNREVKLTFETWEAIVAETLRIFRVNRYQELDVDATLKKLQSQLVNTWNHAKAQYELPPDDPNLVSACDLKTALPARDAIDKVIINEDEEAD